MKVMKMQKQVAQDFKLMADVQELFDAAASCEGPFGMDTYQFYPDPDDAQSLLTLRKAA